MPAPHPSLGALAREVARLTWPAIVGGLLGTIVMFTDRLLLGRYSAAALGSMQVSGPLLWSIFSVFGAFSAGVLAVVGRASGGGRQDAARRAILAALGCAGLVGSLVAVAGFAARHWLALALAGGGPEAAELRELAATFLGIVVLACPLVFVGSASVAALQASGDTRTPMKITAACGLVNLGLSWALLFGRLGLPPLGVAGSAIGTSCSFALQALLALVALRGRGLLVGWPGRDALRGPLRAVLRIAGPAFGEKLIFHSGFLLFAGIVGRLGEVAMAANQALIAIESLGFIAAHGFGVAGGALVARKLGAGQPEEARLCGWISAGLGAASLSAVSLLFLIIPETLVGLFTDDPAVRALGARCLRIAAIAQPIMAISDAMAGALRGAGDTRSPLRVALAGPVLVRLAACWILAVKLDLGLAGIWIGTTLDWAVRAAWLAWLWRRGRWRSLKVEEG